MMTKHVLSSSHKRRSNLSNLHASPTSSNILYTIPPSFLFSLFSFSLFFFSRSPSNYTYLMFSRASSTFTVLNRGCGYLLRPHPSTQRAPFSLSARTFSAVNAAMADTSGITAESLKSKLIEQLQAQHVEIEDLSGRKAIHLIPQRWLLFFCPRCMCVLIARYNCCRRLWPGVSGSHRFPAVREQEYARAAPPG